jgi:sec-independent protein translocase protein TatA
MPFGLHLPELIIVLVIALLVFGPKKLPEMGSAIGKSITAFKKGMNEVTAPKHEELEAPKNAVEETRLPISSTDMEKIGSNRYAGSEVEVEGNAE